MPQINALPTNSLPGRSDSPSPLSDTSCAGETERDIARTLRLHPGVGRGWSLSQLVAPAVGPRTSHAARLIGRAAAR